MERQQIITGGFLMFSAVVFGVSLGHAGPLGMENVDLGAELEKESALDQWVAVTVTLGVSAFAASWAATALSEAL